MVLKKLWFHLFYEGKLVKNFFLKSVRVKAVSTMKDGPPIYFKTSDQPLSKHPYLTKFIQANNVKFSRAKKVEVVFTPVKEMDAYFDKALSQLWFNGKHLTGSAAKANQTPMKTRKSTAQTVSKVKKTQTPKVKFSPSDHSKRKNESLPSSSSAKETFSLQSHMENRGFSKFNFRNVDLYRFLDAFETGCKKSKLNDEDMIASLLFFLNSESKKDFMELQVYKPSSTWNDFRTNWTNKYHEKNVLVLLEILVFNILGRFI